MQLQRCAHILYASGAGRQRRAGFSFLRGAEDLRSPSRSIATTLFFARRVSSGRSGGADRLRRRVVVQKEKKGRPWCTGVFLAGGDGEGRSWTGGVGRKPAAWVTRPFPVLSAPLPSLRVGQLSNLHVIHTPAYTAPGAPQHPHPHHTHTHPRARDRGLQSSVSLQPHHPPLRRAVCAQKSPTKASQTDPQGA